MVTVFLHPRGHQRRFRVAGELRHVNIEPVPWHYLRNQWLKQRGYEQGSYSHILVQTHSITSVLKLASSPDLRMEASWRSSVYADRLLALFRSSSSSAEQHDYTVCKRSQYSGLKAIICQIRPHCYMVRYIATWDCCVESSALKQAST